MRRSILRISALMLAACVPQSLAAQAPAIDRGARVRVTVPSVGPKPFVGVVDSVNGETLMLRTSPEVVTGISFSQMTALDISRGQRRPTWAKTAPLWLTGAAAFVGAMVGEATARKDDVLGPAVNAAAAGVLSGTVGLLVGTGLAIGVKDDMWEPVPGGPSGRRASVRPSVYVAPAERGRIRLGVRAAF